MLRWRGGSSLVSSCAQALQRPQVQNRVQRLPLGVQLRADGTSRGCSASTTTEIQPAAACTGAP